MQTYNEMNANSCGSVVTIQVGQCGNQLGTNLFDALYKYVHYEENRKDVFFVEKTNRNGSSCPVARAVLLDMESKVLQGCLKRRCCWQFESDYCLSNEGGSGNNWAAGYLQNGPIMKDLALELIRKQLEQVDILDGLVMLHSLAGGTGSGLGSFLTEEIKEVFGPVTLANFVIWPRMTGEVAVQSYNSMLSLSHLQGASNSIICLHNDEAFDTCKKSLTIKSPTLQDINSYMARDIAGCLLPSNALNEPRSYLSRNTLLSINNGVTPNPGYKLLELNSYPQLSNESIKFGTFGWKSVVQELRRKTLLSNTFRFADMFILRGRDFEDAKEFFSTKDRFSNEGKNSHKDCIFNFYNRSSLQRSSIRIGRCKNIKSIGGYDRMITHLSNSSRIVEPLSKTSLNAGRMYQAGAYVHQYTIHGLEHDDFINSFMNIEQTIANYKHLSTS